MSMDCGLELDDRSLTMSNNNNYNCAQHSAVDAREKDLELATRIGQQLLESNKELQQRNEFLEEQLGDANEQVQELKHSLQKKATLLHQVVDSEQESWSAPTSPVHEQSNGHGHGYHKQACADCHTGTPRSVIHNTLDSKVRALEKENYKLNEEAAQLRAQTSGLEEKERKLYTDCVKQLQDAYKRIDQLNEDLTDKVGEYETKRSELTRLLSQLSTVKDNERKLVMENDELCVLLHSARETQDELSREVLDLQERYSSVVAMLHEAHQEIKHAHKRPLFRTRSRDSLYESLASELEASDSGMGTARISARSHATNNQTSTEPDYGQSQSTSLMTALKQELHTATNTHTEDEDTHKAQGDRHAPQTDSALYNPYNDTPEHDNQLMSLSTMFSQECQQRAAQLPTRQSTPVPVPVPDMQTQDADQQCHSTRTSPRSCTLSKHPSTDSLLNYQGPAQGEPGVPGTRDLEYAIRKVAARRQVELKYQQFRQQRGYGPSVVHRPMELPSMIAATPPSALFGRARVRLYKPMEGSQYLRQWRALATPSPLSAVGSTDPVTGYTSPLALSQDNGTGSGAGVCSRHMAVTKPATAMGAIHEEPKMEPMNLGISTVPVPVEPCTSTSSTCTNISNSSARSQRHNTPQMSASPQALRRLAARVSGQGEAVGLEVAVTGDCSTLLACTQGVFDRSYAADIAALVSASHNDDLD